MYYYTCLHVCTTTPFWLLGYVSLKIISKNRINIIRHDHQWPSISKNPSPRISRVWQNPRDSKHIQDRQCTEIYWDIKSYTTEHPTQGSSPETQGSSPEMFYDIAQTTILEILITWWFNPSMSSLSHHCISIFQSSRNFLSPFLNFFAIALRIGVVRNFRPSYHHTNHPFIAFEHLSLKRIQASLWHYVAFSGKVNHGRPRYSQVQPGTVRYSQVQPGTVLKRPIMCDLFLEKQVLWLWGYQTPETGKISWNNDFFKGFCRFSCF